MMEKTSWIWLDGKLIPWEDATVHVLTHTLHYCMGAFEGIRCYKQGDGSPGVFPPGITRDTVIRLARDKGIAVREERFTRDELYTAEEAFFTGTAAEITPIREADHRAIGAGKPGPVTQSLQTEYFSVIRGENRTYAHGVTPVQGPARTAVPEEAPPGRLTMPMKIE
jgi:branched-subunit amino acid aminotransferase/4-amino-4-deoxychorismate lyase